MQNSYILNDWKLFSHGKYIGDTELPCLTSNKINGFKINENDSINFKKNLNSKIYTLENPFIYIPSMGYNFKVFQDNKELYSYNKNSFSGFPFHLFPINGNNGTLTIETEYSKHNNGICEKIVLSGKDDILTNILHQDYNTLITLSLGLFISLISIILFIIYKKFKPLIFLSLISFIVSVWTFSNKTNRLKQLLYNNSTLWGYLDLLSLYLIAPTLIIFFKSLIGEKLKFSVQFSSIFIIYFIYCIVSVLFFNLNISHSLLFFNYILVIAGLYLLYALFISLLVKKFTIILSILVAVTFGIHDWIVGIGLTPWEKHYTRYGFLLFIFIVMIDIYITGSKFIKKAISSELKIHAAHEAMDAIAHEIRRPFSIISGFYPAIQSLISSSRNKDSLQNMMPPLQNSLKSVDNLIHDIFAIGNNPQLKLEKITLSDLLIESLNEIWSMNQNLNINLKWNIKFNCLIEIDIAKFKRVISNIVNNAIEAMKGTGDITFSSGILKSKNLLISIHNTNSFIKKELYDKIFEPYATFGKSNGTGLGLAICKSFISAHKGKIIPRSGYEINGTEFSEFSISIPLTVETMSNFQIPEFETPKVWNELGNFSKKENDAIQLDTTFNYKYLLYLKKEIKISFVDDEIVYYHCLIDMISANGLEKNIKIDYFGTIEEFSLKNTDDYNGIIFDLDFGENKLGGIKYLENVDDENLINKISVLSNRISDEIKQKIMDINVKHIYSKPINIYEFSNFVVDAIKNVTNLKPLIAVIDDEKYVHELWSTNATDSEIISFFHPNYFIEECIDRNNILNKISVIVLDYYFDAFGYKLENGFIKILREEGYNGLIVLSSNITPKDELLLSNIDLVLLKKQINYSDIIKLLN